MTFYVERLGLGELCVHSSLYCDRIRSQTALEEMEVPMTSAGEAARIILREVGVASVWDCGVCGSSSSSYGTGGSSGGGHIEEEEPLQG